MVSYGFQRLSTALSPFALTLRPPPYAPTFIMATSITLFHVELVSLLEPHMHTDVPCIKCSCMHYAYMYYMYMYIYVKYMYFIHILHNNNIIIHYVDTSTYAYTHTPYCLYTPCSHEGQVRHYHIKQDESQKYFISEKHRFPTIKELIDYHKLNGGGLVTRLRRPPAQLAPNLHTLSPLFGEL